MQTRVQYQEKTWLGPLSFLVLIDDLNPDCLVHKYVDDTTPVSYTHLTLPTIYSV